MDERTVKARERNRRNRGKKGSFLSLKLAVDFLYFASVVLVIIGFAVPLVEMFLVAGIVMLIGTGYYVYKGVMKMKAAPKGSPAFKDALTTLIFFGIMFCIAILAIVFAAVELSV